MLSLQLQENVYAITLLAMLLEKLITMEKVNHYKFLYVFIVVTTVSLVTLSFRADDHVDADDNYDSEKKR